MNPHKYNLPNNCAHSVLFLLQCKYYNPTSLINFINCKTFTVKRQHRKKPFFQQPIIPFSRGHKISINAHQILERLSALHPAEMNEPVTEVCWGWTGQNSTLPWGEDNSEGGYRCNQWHKEEGGEAGRGRRGSQRLSCRAERAEGRKTPICLPEQQQLAGSVSRSVSEEGGGRPHIWPQQLHLSITAGTSCVHFTAVKTGKHFFSFHLSLILA